MNCPVRFRPTVAILFTVVSAFLATASFAADPPKDDAKKDAAKEEIKVIKPEDAKDNDGKKVTVEFTVLASRELPSGVCFLNSGKNASDADNFTAFITGKGLKKFKADSKTEQPAVYFNKKKVQVTGTIKKYKEKFEIEVESPDQIKIIEEEKKDDAKADAKTEKKS
jgi:DNA/RNA endonuclease YhcR with UshA esterase domain